MNWREKLGAHRRGANPLLVEAADYIEALEAERNAAVEQVEGMQEEGCAAVGLVQNIFNGLTSKGAPSSPMLAEMADACAGLLVEATPCDHKHELERCRLGRQAMEEELLRIMTRCEHEGCHTRGENDSTS